MSRGTVVIWAAAAIFLLGAIFFAARDDGDANETGTTPIVSGAGGVASTTTATSSGEQTTGNPNATESATGNATPDSDGSIPPTQQPVTESPSFPPNELGQIPILEYHHLGPEPEQFVRTPDQFRGDLQWLYEHGFHVVSLHDILTDNINIPAGKRPVALTFDDSPASQFSLIPLSDGRLAIDPNCVVGILEHFFIQHPDFGRGGHFAILPQMLFDWAPVEDRSDQAPYAKEKLEWLVANGYEIGNHTYDHVDLSTLTNDQIMYQLAEDNIAIHELVPDVPVEVVTLPYGMYPAGGDDTLFRGFDYKGQHYAFTAALLVGANPTVSPLSTEYDPYSTARIQAFDEELDKWFGVFTDQPGILYVSDGDPNTVTVPKDLHPWLVDTLDMSKIGNRELVRY
ncbi:MAG TPA: polysaccharide deacetylase family protein [Thermomicrobiales bacterium]|nr:polysaccharide deacetylase family protein [Thermomicrobiales bacterium]